MELRLGSARCDVKHDGNFFVLVSFDIVQYKDRPRMNRQKCNCLLKIERCLSRGAVARGFQVLEVIAELDAFVATLLRSMIDQDDIHSDAVQPGRESAFSPKAGEHLPC